MEQKPLFTEEEVELERERFYIGIKDRVFESFNKILVKLPATIWDVTNLVGVKIGNYTISGVLGKGSYGIVYEAYDENNTECVLKITTRNLQSNAIDWLREVKMTKMITAVLGPEAISVYGFFGIQIRGNWYGVMVMEKMLGDARHIIELILNDIYPLISSAGDEFLKQLEKLLSFLCQNLIAVSKQLILLHSKGMYHLDIKPQNFLCKTTDYKRGWKISLADFGLSCYLPSGRSTEIGCEAFTTYSPPEWRSKVGKSVTDVSELDKAEMYTVGASFLDIINSILPNIRVAKSSPTTIALFKGFDNVIVILRKMSDNRPELRPPSSYVELIDYCERLNNYILKLWQT